MIGRGRLASPSFYDRAGMTQRYSRTAVRKTLRASHEHVPRLACGTHMSRRFLAAALLLIALTSIGCRQPQSPRAAQQTTRPPPIRAPATEQVGFAEADRLIEEAV